MLQLIVIAVEGSDDHVGRFLSTMRAAWIPVVRAEEARPETDRVALRMVGHFPATPITASDALAPALSFTPPVESPTVAGPASPDVGRSDLHVVEPAATPPATMPETVWLVDRARIPQPDGTDRAGPWAFVFYSEDRARIVRDLNHVDEPTAGWRYRRAFLTIDRGAAAQWGR